MTSEDIVLPEESGDFRVLSATPVFERTPYAIIPGRPEALPYEGPRDVPSASESFPTGKEST